MLSNKPRTLSEPLTCNIASGPPTPIPSLPAFVSLILSTCPAPVEKRSSSIAVITKSFEVTLNKPFVPASSAIPRTLPSLTLLVKSKGAAPFAQNDAIPFVAVPAVLSPNTIPGSFAAAGVLLVVPIFTRPSNTFNPLDPTKLVAVTTPALPNFILLPIST